MSNSILNSLTEKMQVAKNVIMKNKTNKIIAAAAAVFVLALVCLFFVFAFSSSVISCQDEKMLTGLKDLMDINMTAVLRAEFGSDLPKDVSINITAIKAITENKELCVCSATVSLSVPSHDVSHSTDFMFTVRKKGDEYVYEVS
ncbi:MAG: hypothetical protein LBJ64_09390 [Deltaproteobacteria bacterium]|jgi:hypothetical protein|nr:hypothetical protein [Deltaproteobacteria bacterium]